MIIIQEALNEFLYSPGSSPPEHLGSAVACRL